MEFRAEGRLGCPHDYDVFRRGLEPILERIHRSTRHLGKCPRRGTVDPARQAEVVELRRQLRQAIDTEAYEEAARLAMPFDKRMPRMNLDSLTHTSGEWLRGSGPESDIVISSRIRLARNLAAFPFTNRASAHQKGEIETLLRDRIAKLEPGPKLDYVHLPSIPALDRQFLVERQLISRELAGADGPRGVAIGPRETVSIMVNEEDHIRLQVMRSGFTLDEAWQDIDKVDDLLEQRVSYAFSDEFGYLTACPTNVGTGMRASVMLHLPALVLTRQVEKVFRACRRSTWQSAACTAREAGPLAISIKSPTRSRWARAKPPSLARFAKSSRKSSPTSGRPGKPSSERRSKRSRIEFHGPTAHSAPPP